MKHFRPNLPALTVGLVHGRLKADEKQAVMAAFAAGDIDVLVATTVIEVGVDVPNASLMVIEHAERFGLSQLHQLRGRVGRGQYESSCVLIYAGPLGEVARQRLKIIFENTDGFEIARQDLADSRPRRIRRQPAERRAAAALRRSGNGCRSGRDGARRCRNNADRASRTGRAPPAALARVAGGVAEVVRTSGGIRCLILRQRAIGLSEEL